jgi:hypothetical protein
MRAKLFLALTCLLASWVAAAAPRGREPGDALLATPPSRAAAEGVSHRPALGARVATVPDGRRLSGTLKLCGDSHVSTLAAANNYASSLIRLKRFEEAKSLLRKTMAVARRALGASHTTTLKLRWIYGEALYEDADATLDDLHEAVTTLEDAGRIARRVLGGAHPTTVGIERALRTARAALRARETPPPGSA